MKPDLIDDILNALQSALPPGLGAMGQDLREHMRLKLQALLKDQGLVTQENFETQCQVLLRSREKLEALEKRVAALEKST
jgi:BMFP domain-containing protein YqiC